MYGELQALPLPLRAAYLRSAALRAQSGVAKLSHPAYALSDEEAQQISPQIQALLQAVADKYAPALVGRVATRHPELFDAIAAVGVLYFQKWRLVSRLQKLEAAERARAAADRQQPKERAEAEAFAAAAVAESFPERPKVGERDSSGTLII